LEKEEVPLVEYVGIQVEWKTTNLYSKMFFGKQNVPNLNSNSITFQVEADKCTPVTTAHCCTVWES